MTIIFKHTLKTTDPPTLSIGEIAINPYTGYIYTQVNGQTKKVGGSAFTLGELEDVSVGTVFDKARLQFSNGRWSTYYNYWKLRDSVDVNSTAPVKQGYLLQWGALYEDGKDPAGLTPTTPQYLLTELIDHNSPINPDTLPNKTVLRYSIANSDVVLGRAIAVFALPGLEDVVINETYTPDSQNSVTTGLPTDNQILTAYPLQQFNLTKTFVHFRWINNNLSIFKDKNPVIGGTLNAGGYYSYNTQFKKSPAIIIDDVATVTTDKSYWVLTMPTANKFITLTVDIAGIQPTTCKIVLVEVIHNTSVLRLDVPGLVFENHQPLQFSDTRDILVFICHNDRVYCSLFAKNCKNTYKETLDHALST